MFGSILSIASSSLASIVPSIFVLVLSTSEGLAQGVTPTIVSDNTLGTQVNQNGNVSDITGGTRPGGGANLFHSFGEFGVPTNNIANFLNDAGLPTTNILSRVTSGNPSNIFGTIQTEGFGNANLFLMNPAGIVFGPNASLNVGGSTHFTTADYLKLGDGVQFTGLPSGQDALLSIAPVAAFGFLGSNISPISVEDSTLSVDKGQTIALVGGDIAIEGSLTALDGQIGVASVGSQGEVLASTFDMVPNVNGESFTSMGAISLLPGASVESSGYRGGTVLIRGGELRMDNSTISANAEGVSSEPTNHLIGEGIDIHLSGDAFLRNGSVLETNVFADVDPGVGSGGVRIVGNHIDISNGSIIDSSVRAGSPGGRSGDIVIESSSLDIHDFGFLLALTEGMLDGGDIFLKVTQDVRIGPGSFVFTNTEALGNAGDIIVQAGRVFLSGGDLADFAGISSDADEIPPFGNPTGNVGNIRVVTNHLDIQNAEISTPTFSNGDSGDIDIIVNGDVFFSGSPFPEIFRGISANTFGMGQGGNLQITADNLHLTNRGSLQASSLDPAVAFGGEDLFSRSQVPEGGDAGQLTLNIDRILRVDSGAFIQVRSETKGAAGNTQIAAQDILVTGIADAINFELSPEFTGISASTFDGQGGNLTIQSDNLLVKDKAFINTATFGSGDSGDIDIIVEGKLLVENGGQIFANTRSSGDGGSINIDANQVMISGENLISAIRLFDNTPLPVKSAVTSQSQGASGAGGNISISSGSFTLNSGASVTAESNSTGSAGNIQLTATDTIVLDDGTITTEATQGSGGNIQLTGDELIRLNDSVIASSVKGDATTVGGDIGLASAFITLQNSQILARAVEGQGGNISLVATNAVLADPLSTLDASSALGVSGSVDIQAPIQNLSGTLAPLPEETVPVTALYGARCAAGPGGHFSTFVDSKADSLAPGPGTFLASPIVLPLASTPQVAQLPVSDRPPVMLTASLAPLVFGQSSLPNTACP